MVCTADEGLKITCVTRHFTTDCSSPSLLYSYLPICWAWLLLGDYSAWWLHSDQTGSQTHDCLVESLSS